MLLLNIYFQQTVKSTSFLSSLDSNLTFFGRNKTSTQSVKNVFPLHLFLNKIFLLFYLSWSIYSESYFVFFSGKKRGEWFVCFFRTHRKKGSEIKKKFRETIPQRFKRKFLLFQLYWLWGWKIKVLGNLEISLSSFIFCSSQQMSRFLNKRIKEVILFCFIFGIDFIELFLKLVDSDF